MTMTSSHVRTSRLAIAIALAFGTPLAFAQAAGGSASASPTTTTAAPATSTASATTSTTAATTTTTTSGNTATITTESGRTVSTPVPAPTTAGAAVSRTADAAGTNRTGATAPVETTAGAAVQRAQERAAGQATTTPQSPVLDPATTPPLVDQGVPPVQPATPPADANAVAARVKLQGYTEVTDVAFVDGLWHAEARAENGTWREIVIDPRNGRVLTGSDSRLDADDVVEQLRTAGYTDVPETNFADGHWDVEAIDANGNRVSLKLAPDGAIMAQLPDTD